MSGSAIYAFNLNGRAYPLSKEEQACANTTLKISKTVTTKVPHDATPVLTDDGDESQEYTRVLCIGIKPPNSAAETSRKSQSASITEILNNDTMLLDARVDHSSRTLPHSGKMFCIASHDGKLIAYPMKEEEAFVFKQFRDDEIKPKATRKTTWAAIQRAAHEAKIGRMTLQPMTNNTELLSSTQLLYDILTARALLEQADEEHFHKALAIIKHNCSKILAEVLDGQKGNPQDVASRNQTMNVLQRFRALELGLQLRINTIDKVFERQTFKQLDREPIAATQKRQMESYCFDVSLRQRRGCPKVNSFRYK
ncbi:hypothetical protein MCOR25_009006 [Pyricularia grisea]|nr:hypothetical protein MCOR25_009006 [Pyricularia grisea]